MASVPDRELEDKVYDLLSDHTTGEIAAKLGISWSEAVEVSYRVINERGTPALAASREALRRLGEIRFV